jgi:hypothetical protein
MAISNYCTSELTDHEVNNCAEEKMSGIDSIALIFEENIANYSSAANWNTAITNNEVFMIKEILGQHPAASPFTGKARTGCTPLQVPKGYTYTVTYEDRNVQGANDTFYSLAKPRSGTFRIAWRNCEEAEIRVSTSARVAIDVGNPVSAEDNQESQFYPVTLTWTDGLDSVGSTVHNEPAGIF